MWTDRGSVGLLKREELSEALSLLRTLNVSYGGLNTRALHWVLCTSRSMLTIAGREQAHVAGIAIIELNRSWMWEHPLQTWRMLLRRFAKDVRASSGSAFVSGLPPLPVTVSRSNSPVSWRAPAPRTVFIGVDPQYRGRGLGSALYREAFARLGRDGRTQLLARIDPHNTASLWLHAQTGWQMYFDGHVITALKRLPETEAG